MATLTARAPSDNAEAERKNPRENVRNAEPRCRISVIIPSFNCASTIGELICALISAPPTLPWEIVVADNGSADESRAVVDRWQRSNAIVRWVDASIQPGPGFARRVGAASACGDFLMFIDADDLPAPGYLDAMASALELEPVVHAHVSTDVVNEGPIAANWRSPGDGLINEGAWPFPLGGTLGIRRSVYEEIGGFAADFPASEDSDFGWRLLVHGYQVAAVPRAVLWYRLRSAPRSIFRQYRYYGRCQGYTNRMWRSRNPTIDRDRELFRRASAVMRNVRMITSTEGRRLLAPEVGAILGRTEGALRWTGRTIRDPLDLADPRTDPLLAQFRRQAADRRQRLNEDWRNSRLT